MGIFLSSKIFKEFVFHRITFIKPSHLKALLFLDHPKSPNNISDVHK